MVIRCPNCGRKQELDRRIGFKVGGAAIGATLGCAASRSVVGGLVGAGLGALAGHLLERELLPLCSECGTMMRELEHIS
jgi:hypothetical protein